MKKTRIMLLAVMFAALGFTACSGGTESTETTAAASSAEEVSTEESGGGGSEAAQAEGVEEDRVYIGAVAAEAGIPYFTTMQWGALDAAKDYNVELYWTGPAE